MSDCKRNPQLSYFGTKTRVEFRGSCLKQDKITFNHWKIVNIYIVYEFDKIYVKTSPTLVNCLFGAVIGYGLDLIVVFIQLVMDLVEM